MSETPKCGNAPEGYQNRCVDLDTKPDSYNPYEIQAIRDEIATREGEDATGDEDAAAAALQELENNPNNGAWNPEPTNDYYKGTKGAGGAGGIIGSKSGGGAGMALGL